MGEKSPNFYRFNVGGQLHMISGATLALYPETLLGRLARLDPNEAALLCDQFNPESKEFYFDRSPYKFKIIADFYRSGKFHIPSDPCKKQTTIEELQFWQIPNHFVSDCCKMRVGVQRKKMMKGMSKKARVVDPQNPSGQLENSSSTASAPLLKRSISQRLRFSSQKLGFLLSEVEPDYGTDNRPFRHSKMLVWVNIENPGVTWYSLVLLFLLLCYFKFYRILTYYVCYFFLWVNFENPRVIWYSLELYVT